MVSNVIIFMLVQDLWYWTNTYLKHELCFDRGFVKALANWYATWTCWSINDFSLLGHKWSESRLLHDSCDYGKLYVRITMLCQLYHKEWLISWVEEIEVHHEDNLIYFSHNNCCSMFYLGLSLSHLSLLLWGSTNEIITMKDNISKNRIVIININM